METLELLFNNWAETFFAEKQQPMSEELTEILMSILILEMKGADLEEIPIELENDAGFMLTHKRAKFIKLNLTTTATIFLSMLERNPGSIVMYLYALKYNQLKYSSEKYSLSDITSIFPMGFLSEESLSKMWALQKVEGKNLLDLISFM